MPRLKSERKMEKVAKPATEVQEHSTKPNPKLELPPTKKKTEANE
jgi:hypothetical protein